MAVTQRKKNVGNLIQVIYYRAVIARASVFENFMRGLIQESARLNFGAHHGPNLLYII